MDEPLKEQIEWFIYEQSCCQNDIPSQKLSHKPGAAVQLTSAHYILDSHKSILGVLLKILSLPVFQRTCQTIAEI